MTSFRRQLVVLCSLITSIVHSGAIAMAAQTGPLIAELVDYGDVRATVPASTEATFACVVVANQEQRQAATSMIEGARTELARVIHRHLRTVRDDPTYSQIRESEQQVLTDAASVERQLMADLRSLLLPEQEGQFEKFERAHRRSLTQKVKPQCMPLDVWVFLEANGVSPQDNERLARLLDTFDRDGDAALVRYRRALLAHDASVRQGSDGTDAAEERTRRIRTELYRSKSDLDQVSAQVVENLLALLSPDVADKLVMEVISTSTAEFDANLAVPDRYPVVREVLALDLPAQLRARVQAKVAEARVQALSLARECAVEQARFVLLDAERRSERATSPTNVYLGKASELRKALSAEILALLNEKQRQAYNASEVIDPSASSVVNDE